MHKDDFLAEDEGHEEISGFTVRLDGCVSLQIQYNISF